MEITGKPAGDPQWSELPALVVEKIYSYLNRRDQESMSLVCHSWLQEYSSPILWRRMKFCFPDVENGTELCPDVVLARRYGTMFHRVDIMYSEENYEENDEDVYEENDEQMHVESDEEMSEGSDDEINEELDEMFEGSDEKMSEGSDDEMYEGNDEEIDEMYEEIEEMYEEIDEMHEEINEMYEEIEEIYEEIEEMHEETGEMFEESEEEMFDESDEELYEENEEMYEEYEEMNEEFPIPVTTILMQVKSFMQAVTIRSQLFSISFKDMFIFFHKAGDAVYGEVYQVILQLIKSQKKLRYIKFDCCLFKKLEAEDIIKAIFVYTSETLRHLHLKEFIFQRIDDELADLTVDDEIIFRVMMNLRSLSIDYSLLFEKLMLSFYEYRNTADMSGTKGCLEEMNLICKDFGLINYLGIHPLEWKYFRKIFPYLRLNLHYLSRFDAMRFSTIIVPHMPLRSMSFNLHTGIFDEPSIKEVGTLLRRVTYCDINKSLEVLKIIWLAKSPNLGPDLISFTSVCPELNTLHLQTEHPVAGLDTVFNSWLENRPVSLRVVNIIVRSVETAEQKLYYILLFCTFAPLLQNLGIDFFGTATE